MAIQIRTEQQRNSDLVRISKLYLQGHTQLEIAQQIGVSRTQISYDIKQLFLEWKRERIDVFEERLLIELSKLDQVVEVTGGLFLDIFIESKGLHLNSYFERHKVF